MSYLVRLQGAVLMRDILLKYKNLLLRESGASSGASYNRLVSVLHGNNGTVLAQEVLRPEIVSGRVAL